MKYPRWLLLFVLACIGSSGYGQGPDSSSLTAPTQLSPATNAHLHGFPRRIFFEWSTVDEAGSYGIEIEYYDGKWSSEAQRPTYMYWVNDTSLVHDFVGNQPGAWRVWAMDKKGHPGQVSAWSIFTFGPDNVSLPASPPDTLPQFSRLTRAPVTSPPLGKPRELPVFDPVTHQPCSWPAPQDQTGAQMPKPIYTPQPEFPEAARKARVDGAVRLAVDVGEDGLVKRACVLSAAREDMGLASAETVRTWRFKPAQKDGKPMAYSFPVEVTFNLYKGPR